MARIGIALWARALQLMQPTRPLAAFPFLNAEKNKKKRFQVVDICCTDYIKYVKVYNSI